VTGGVRGRGARILRLDRSALARGAATVVDGTVGDAGAAEVVSVGRAQPEHEVAVVDPERGRRLAEGEVGEIWVRGPSVASGGYWRMPEASEQAFSARIERGEERFLRTGDLGFLSGGELFVTGRLKDLLIVRGRKLHPHDVEDAAQLVDSRLRAGCGAAVAVETPEGEGIALIQECSTRDAAELKDLVGEIRRGVIQRLNVGLSGVVLTAPRSVPKTSSGKLRRRHCLEAYRVGALTVLHEEWMNTPPARHERVAGR
jgi:acyl-CoA synthetase (AMP-forming)/AMP-acid ligase II